MPTIKKARAEGSELLNQLIVAWEKKRAEHGTGSKLHPTTFTLTKWAMRPNVRGIEDGDHLVPDPKMFAYKPAIDLNVC